MTNFPQVAIDQGFFIAEKDDGVNECAFTRASGTEADSTTVASNFAIQIRALVDHYNEREALVLLQLSPDDGVVSVEAKKIYADLAKDPHIMRLAIFGGLEKYRIIANLLLPLRLNPAMHVFATKKEALSWLMHS